MKVSLEHLYHYNCDRCKKWWTCADIKPEVGGRSYCPHCGYANTVEEIESFQVSDRPIK